MADTQSDAPLDHECNVGKQAIQFGNEPLTPRRKAVMIAQLTKAQSDVLSAHCHASGRQISPRVLAAAAKHICALWPQSLHASPVYVSEAIVFHSAVCLRSRASAISHITAIRHVAVIRALYPRAKATHAAPQRLFLAALVFASRQILDIAAPDHAQWSEYTAWAFSPSDIAAMEAEMALYLGHNALTTLSELDDHARHLAELAGGAPLVPGSMPLSDLLCNADD